PLHRGLPCRVDEKPDCSPPGFPRGAEAPLLHRIRSRARLLRDSTALDERKKTESHPCNSERQFAILQLLPPRSSGVPEERAAVCERLSGVREALKGYAWDFDASALPAPVAARVVEEAAAIEHIASTLKSLA